MNWHRRVMALGFRFAGFLLAMTSLVVLEEAGYSAYVVHNAPPPDNSAPLDIGKYGLVGLLTNGAQVAGRAVHTLSFAAGWILAAVAVVAFVAFLLAVLIYFTGGGISRQRGWARVVGVLLSLGLAARHDPRTLRRRSQCDTDHGGAGGSFALHALGAHLALRVKRDRNRDIGPP